jgi:hypothetical protein
LFLVLYSNYYFLSATHGAPGLAGAVVTTLMPILVYLLMLFSKQKGQKNKVDKILAIGHEAPQKNIANINHKNCCCLIFIINSVVIFHRYGI